MGLASTHRDCQSTTVSSVCGRARVQPVVELDSRRAAASKSQQVSRQNYERWAPRAKPSQPRSLALVMQQKSRSSPSQRARLFHRCCPRGGQPLAELPSPPPPVTRPMPCFALAFCTSAWPLHEKWMTAYAERGRIIFEECKTLDEQRQEDLLMMACQRSWLLSVRSNSGERGSIISSARRSSYE